jgi:hypothetical protein
MGRVLAVPRVYEFGRVLAVPRLYEFGRVLAVPRLYEFERVLSVPSLYAFYPDICLTTEEEARKNLRQGSRRVPVGTMETEYTEQSIHDNKNT